MASESVEIEDVRTVLAAIGAPRGVSAELPELRYHWECACAVVIDSDRVSRTWTPCAAHVTLSRQGRRAS